MEFVRNKDYTAWYSTKQKMPSGMTAEIQFQGLAYFSGVATNYNKPLIFNVSAVVYKKRKHKQNHYQEASITGKDGLKPLMFFKKAIIEFEQFCSENSYINQWSDIYLEVYWLDNRRRNVYERGLKSEGFEFSINDGYKTLIKKIK